MVSALAVSGAIFLILELDEPFGGLIGISSEPMLNACTSSQNEPNENSADTTILNRSKQRERR